MKNFTRRFQKTRVLSALTGAMLLANCTAVGHGAEGPPKETRVVVFWDLTRSITGAERRSWKRELAGLTTRMGEELWEKSEYDEVVVFPLHLNTVTSTPLIRQRFSGFEFDVNVRRAQQASYAEQLTPLDSLTVDDSVLQGTDVVGGVGRAREYFAADTARVREVVFFSDMSHSMPALDFEGDPMPFAREGAADMAQRVIAERGWGSRDLADVEVHVHLPGTISGARGMRDEERLDAMRLFWYAMFEKLGAEIVTWQRM